MVQAPRPHEPPSPSSQPLKGETSRFSLHLRHRLHRSSVQSGRLLRINVSPFSTPARARTPCNLCPPKFCANQMFAWFLTLAQKRRTGLIGRRYSGKGKRARLVPMPVHSSALQAALIGYQAEITRIQDAMAAIRSQLKGSGGTIAAPAEPRKRSEFSAASRKKDGGCSKGPLGENPRGEGDVATRRRSPFLSTRVLYVQAASALGKNDPFLLT
jgi:hypothetical protein